MKLEIGKTYKVRDEQMANKLGWPEKEKINRVDKDGIFYSKEGSYYENGKLFGGNGQDTWADLIEEVIDIYDEAVITDAYYNWDGVGFDTDIISWRAGIKWFIENKGI
jgi:hypothetical protein